MNFPMTDIQRLFFGVISFCFFAIASLCIGGFIASIFRERRDAVDRIRHSASVVGRTLSEIDRLKKIEAMVKIALSQRGDDVCWRDLYNEEMAELVGVEFDPEFLPRDVFLGNCSHFYDCLASGNKYRPPNPSLAREAP